MPTLVRKLFKYGNSKAITLPKELVDTVKGREVVVVYSPEGVMISSKSRLDTLESDPLFATFIQAIAAEAMQHPERLHDPAQAWSPEVVKLFNRLMHLTPVATICGSYRSERPHAVAHMRCIQESRA